MPVVWVDKTHEGHPIRMWWQYRRWANGGNRSKGAVECDHWKIVNGAHSLLTIMASFVIQQEGHIYSRYGVFVLPMFAKLLHCAVSRVVHQQTSSISFASTSSPYCPNWCSNYPRRVRAKEGMEEGGTDSDRSDTTRQELFFNWLELSYMTYVTRDVLHA